MVLFYVAKGGADATLCRTGVRSRWVELRQHRGGNSFARQLERRPESGATGTDDNGIDVNVGRFGAQTCGHFSGSVKMTLLPNTTRAAARIQSRVMTTCCAVPLR